MEPGFGVRFLVWAIVVLIGAGFSNWTYHVYGPYHAIVVATFFVLTASVLALYVYIAKDWQRAIVLRLGKFSRVEGPGLFFVVPIIDRVAFAVDTRTVTTAFSAELTITSDTVPVDINAVLFWKVDLPENAALKVENYSEAVFRAAQTALRDVIGRSSLAKVLAETEAVGQILKSVIDSRTEPWGVKVEGVEIRDVHIPPELQSAMSREAQAQRERQARLILGETELDMAQKFSDAAKIYANNPTALHLRALTILAEGIKEHSSLVLVPCSALDSLNLGALTGISSLASNYLRPPEFASEPAPLKTEH